MSISLFSLIISIIALVLSIFGIYFSILAFFNNKKVNKIINNLTKSVSQVSEIIIRIQHMVDDLDKKNK